MIYKNQSCHDLELNIIKGSFDSSNFEILSSNTIMTPLGKLEAAIIGGSHYFQLYNHKNQLLFTEVLACYEFNKLAHQKRYQYKDFKQLQNIDLKFDSIHYQTKIWQQQWEEDLINGYCHPHKITKEDQASTHFNLVFTFPDADNYSDAYNNSSESITSISVSNLNTAIEIKTLHSYPNEKKIVLSHTHLSHI